MNLKKRLHLLVGLLLVCLVLLATGTYAAYTNTASIKRVVTTGIDSDVPPFSSNYLLECSGNNYYRYRISASETGDTTLYLTLFNYPRNNSTKPSTTNITYTLQFDVISDDGHSFESNELPVVSPGLKDSYTLNGGGVDFHTYTLTFSRELVKKMEGCCLRVTAKATSLTPNYTLGADFYLVSVSGRSTNWSGKWMESDPSFSDALNYEISGTSEGTVKVDWSASANDIKLSKWCIEDASSSGDYFATFNVGGVDEPTSFLLQFYFKNGRTAVLPTINISFTPKTSDASSSGADSPT